MFIKVKMCELEAGISRSFSSLAWYHALKAKTGKPAERFEVA